MPVPRQPRSPARSRKSPIEQPTSRSRPSPLYGSRRSRISVNFSRSRASCRPEVRTSNQRSFVSAVRYSESTTSSRTCGFTKMSRQSAQRTKVKPCFSKRGRSPGRCSRLPRDSHRPDVPERYAVDLREEPERGVPEDVVADEDAASAEAPPGDAELEEHVPRRVQRVVEEQVDGLGCEAPAQRLPRVAEHELEAVAQFVGDEPRGLPPLRDRDAEGVARVGDVEGDEPALAAVLLERPQQEGRARAVERPGLDDEPWAKRPYGQVEELLALLGGLGVAGCAGGGELVAGLAGGLRELLVDARRDLLELFPGRAKPERGERLDGGVLAAGADAQGRIAPAVAGDARQARGLANERHRASRSSASSRSNGSSTSSDSRAPITYGRQSPP